MNGLRHFLLALQFFTRIPVTGRLAHWVGYSPAMLRQSAAHFPGVGWVVGGLVALLSALLFANLPNNPFTPLVVAVLTTAASLWITGAFHEDGLADVADGLGGHVTRARALEIMKDSRLGTYGVAALALVLLCKVSLLALIGAVGAQTLAWALLLGHVVSRVMPLFIIRTLTHVGNEDASKSKPLADQISLPALGVAILWVIATIALVKWSFPAMSLVVPLLSMGLAWVWIARLFWQRLQGFTGDCLGATQQVCEAAFYLGLALTF
jgi:adenosylcobinamide-GDP ribazoletransferase